VIAAALVLMGSMKARASLEALILATGVIANDLRA
jgi:hypothetical protein